MKAEDSKTVPICPNSCFQTRVISLQRQESIFFGTPCMFPTKKPQQEYVIYCCGFLVGMLKAEQSCSAKSRTLLFCHLDDPYPESVLYCCGFCVGMLKAEHCCSAKSRTILYVQLNRIVKCVLPFVRQKLF